jgi:acetyltransferase-like isoleucine patch superfamily enzyme
VLDKFVKLLEVVNANFSLRKCTSVGLLTRVAGKVIIDNPGIMNIGSRVKIRASHVPVELATFWGAKLTIGDGTFINSGVSICAQQSVSIGKNCGIGNYTLIMDTDFHTIGDFASHPEARPIVIEDDVWIGANVVVLKGVHIGTGAVVGAGSIVVKDVPAHCVYAGNPARLIRTIGSADEEVQAKPANTPL